MGINAPTLYAAFGDKLNLYKQSIEYYLANNACAPMIAFESEPDIRKAVSTFMEAIIDYATQNESGAKGCFLSSCVATSAGEVEGVDNIIKKAIQDTDIRLAKRFEQEKSKKVLAADFPSLERARLMFDLGRGHVFRARAGLNDKEIKIDLDYRVRIILD